VFLALTLIVEVDRVQLEFVESWFLSLAQFFGRFEKLCIVLGILWTRVERLKERTLARLELGPNLPSILHAINGIFVVSQRS
jgi:hypothetical protein